MCRASNGKITDKQQEIWNGMVVNRENIKLGGMKNHKNLRSGKLVPLLRFKPHASGILMLSVTAT
jgi:hypothetical protein